MAGSLYTMIGIPIAVTNAEKMLKNFAFGKLPVRRRQDQHRIGAGLLRVLADVVVVAHNDRDGYRR